MMVTASFGEQKSCNPNRRTISNLFQAILIFWKIGHKRKSLKPQLPYSQFSAIKKKNPGKRKKALIQEHSHHKTSSANKTG